MKKAFTLAEMLIVVAVLVTLMTIAFRLSSLGSDQSRRNRTIARLQRLENCLSGYYAAFGAYPAVALHGSRNIYLQVDAHGIQDIDGQEDSAIWGWYKDSGDHGIGSTDEERAWLQVQAACRAQPADCQFPFPEKYQNFVKMISREIVRRANSGEERYKSYWSNEQRKQKLAAGFDDGVTDNIGRHNKGLDKTDWREVQLFKFGLMSYLLPRYLVMMNGDRQFFEESCKQWSQNNTLPCDAMTGRAFNDWSDVKTYAGKTDQPSDLARVANIPSQALCARWIPNLQGICSCNHSVVLFGVDIDDQDIRQISYGNPDLDIYQPNGNGSGGYSGQYVLDSITVKDGWHHEFFYYSPPPYQSYTLWSAGPNGRTFPPWIDRKGLTGDANRCIGVWIQDDIIHMSN